MKNNKYYLYQACITSGIFSTPLESTRNYKFHNNQATKPDTFLFELYYVPQLASQIHAPRLLHLQGQV